MAHIFKYAILVAIPDERRGERVNVGIAIFLPERLDVRFAELGKLRVIAGGDWSNYAADVSRRLADRFVAGAEPEKIVGQLPVDPVFQVSGLGWLSVDNVDDYEDRVKEILTALVLKPRADARPKSTRINTEIARQLKKGNVLAQGDESLDSHKVVRDFQIEEDLVADFALKNGAMNIAATLDLRRPHVDIKEATLKAIVLDRAQNMYTSGHVKRLGIYAADPITTQGGQYRSHIKLMHEYAQHVYNWEDPGERQAFIHAIYGAAGFRGPLV